MKKLTKIGEKMNQSLQPDYIRINWRKITVLIIAHLAAAFYSPFAYKFVDIKRFKLGKKTKKY